MLQPRNAFVNDIFPNFCGMSNDTKFVVKNENLSFCRVQTLLFLVSQSRIFQILKSFTCSVSVLSQYSSSLNYLSFCQ